MFGFARQARSFFLLSLVFALAATGPAEAQQLSPPQVAGSADGSFVVTWLDLIAGGRIVGQRFDSLGNRIGDEFAIDEPDLEGTSHSVAAAANGNFVVSWDRTTAEVMGQRFDSNGHRLGDSFVVSGSGYFETAAGMSADGGFVIAWASWIDPITARRFDASGKPVGSEFTVGGSGGRGLTPAIGMKDDGAFVVAWRAPFELDGQLYDNQGRVVSTFRVDLPTHTGAFASTDMAADGSFVIAWHLNGGRQIYASRYDPTGQRLGDPFLVNPNCVALPGVATAMTSDGDFFVVWSCNRPGAVSDVVAQRFDRFGQRVGPELLIDPAWPVGRTVPSAAIAGHVLVVAWTNHAQDGDGVGIRRLEIAPGPHREGDGPDRDGDGIADGLDNCPTVANPDQADAAGDGYGDDCVSPDVFIPTTASLGRNPVIGVGTVIGDGVVVGDDVVLGEGVVLEPQVTLGARSEIGDFVVIGRGTMIGDDVAIGFGAKLEGKVRIANGAILGDRVVIRRNVVIGNGAAIDPLAQVFAGAHIGANATLGMGARVGRRAIVRPGATVPPGTSVPAGTTYP